MSVKTISSPINPRHGVSERQYQPLQKAREAKKLKKQQQQQQQQQPPPLPQTTTQQKIFQHVLTALKISAAVVIPIIFESFLHNLMKARVSQTYTHAQPHPTPSNDPVPATQSYNNQIQPQSPPPTSQNPPCTVQQNDPFAGVAPL